MKQKFSRRSIGAKYSPRSYKENAKCPLKERKTGKNNRFDRAVWLIAGNYISRTGKKPSLPTHDPSSEEYDRKFFEFANATLEAMVAQWTRDMSLQPEPAARAQTIRRALEDEDSMGVVWNYAAAAAAMTILDPHPGRSNVNCGVENSNDGRCHPRKLAGFLCPDAVPGLLWRGCDGTMRFGARRSPPIQRGFSAPAARLVRKAIRAALAIAALEGFIVTRYRAPRRASPEGARYDHAQMPPRLYPAWVAYRPDTVRRKRTPHRGLTDAHHRDRRSASILRRGLQYRRHPRPRLGRAWSTLISIARKP